MRVKVANNRFIVSSLKGWFGFYQQLVGNVSNFQELGQQLVSVIEAAQAYRQTSKVEELGIALSNFPIKEYRLIGEYYLGWCAYRKGGGSATVFEKVAEQSQTYRAKAFWSLGAIESSRGNCEAELRYFTESMKYTRDLSTRIELARGIAVVKAKEGYHRQALKDLEELVPLVRYANPYAYYDFLNSFAVELMEAGRINEARSISNIVLASPYAFEYPEWRETSDDIERKGYHSSRSFVPIIQGATQDNIVRLPERETIPVSRGEPARILHYDWHNMVKEPNDETQIEDLEGLSENDLMVKLLYLATNKGVTEIKLRKVVAYALKVFSEPED